MVGPVISCPGPHGLRDARHSRLDPATSPKWASLSRLAWRHADADAQQQLRWKTSPPNLAARVHAIKVSAVHETPERTFHRVAVPLDEPWASEHGLQIGRPGCNRPNRPIRPANLHQNMPIAHGYMGSAWLTWVHRNNVFCLIDGCGHGCLFYSLKKASTAARKTGACRSSSIECVALPISKKRLSAAASNRANTSRPCSGVVS